MIQLTGRHFLKIADYSPEELDFLLELAARLKAARRNGTEPRLLEGRRIALIFEKDSTRTRCSFETAAYDQGAHCTLLGAGSQIGKKESMADTARVLSRMFDGIEYRGHGQNVVEELARHSSVPVWNGLTNEAHPTQILADFLTMREHCSRPLSEMTFAYLGDARYNMGNSLMVACARMGMHFTACTTKEYFPEAELVRTCEEIAAGTGGSITLTEDVAAGAGGADVVYTDVWVSMGEPAEVWESRLRDLMPYQVNRQVMEYAGEKAVFMHCLPAFHDLNTGIGKEIHEKYRIDEMEVTDEVFESPQSIVFEEAENRMHTIKAVMAVTLGEYEV